jgi:hypothetical protein
MPSPREQDRAMLLDSIDAALKAISVAGKLAARLEHPTQSDNLERIWNELSDVSYYAYGHTTTTGVDTDQHKAGFRFRHLYTDPTSEFYGTVQVFEVKMVRDGVVWYFEPDAPYGPMNRHQIPLRDFPNIIAGAAR